MVSAKFYILFTRDEQGQQVVFRKKRYKTLPKFVQFAQKSFQMDWSHPIYISGLTRVYILNWTTGVQLLPSGQAPALRPEDLDVIVGTKIIREITSTVAQGDFKLKLLWGVLGAILGGLAVGLIVYIYMSGRIEDILKSQVPNVIPVGAAIGGAIRALLA